MSDPKSPAGPGLLGFTNRIIAHDSEKEFRLILKWKRPLSMILYALAIGWNVAFVIGLMGWIMTTEHNLVILGFLGAELVTGLIVLYIALAMMQNFTVVRVTASSFRIMHGPIKWPGNLKIESKEIVQVTHIERPSTRRLRILVRGGKVVDVIDGLGEPHQARFIQFQVERHLGMIKAVSVSENELFPEDE